MIVVLDTNVVLQALNPRHEFAPIMDEWHAGRFIWAVSTEILLEYREVIVRQSGAARWDSFDRLLHLAAAYRKNLLHVSPSCNCSGGILNPNGIPHHSPRLSRMAGLPWVG
jgi:predicted nucleic acid-binding protein